MRATDTLMVFPYPEKSSDGKYHMRFFSHGLRYVPAVVQFIDEHLPPLTQLFLLDPKIRTIRQQWRCALLIQPYSLGIARASSRLMSSSAADKFQPRYTWQLIVNRDALCNCACYAV